MKLSSNDLFNKINIETKKNFETENCYQRNTKKKKNVQNEGTILYYIMKSDKRESTKTVLSEIPNKTYELSMINTYNEDIDSNLSFISEFDLEEENNKDSSFNSSDKENKVEEIVIFKNSKERILFDKEKEDDDSKLEKEWNDIVEFLSYKEH